MEFAPARVYVMSSTRPAKSWPADTYKRAICNDGLPQTREATATGTRMCGQSVQGRLAYESSSSAGKLEAADPSGGPLGVIEGGR